MQRLLVFPNEEYVEVVTNKLEHDHVEDVLYRTPAVRRPGVANTGSIIMSNTPYSRWQWKIDNCRQNIRAFPKRLPCQHHANQTFVPLRIGI